MAEAERGTAPEAHLGCYSLGSEKAYFSSLM